MKVGDYLQPIESFTREIYSITKDNITGEIIDNIILKDIHFNKYKKYKITRIFKTFDVELVEIIADDITVHFTSTLNTSEYEYIHDLFQPDLSSKRKEKLKQLNKISHKNIFSKLFDKFLGPR